MLQTRMAETAGNERWWRTPLAALLLSVAAFAAYHNTFGVPFLLDDDGAIRENPALDLSRPLDVLFPPVHATTAARPLLNLSFALNHAVHGYSLGGYHLVNLAIHILAALTLCGVLGALGRRVGAGTGWQWVALAGAAVWMLHPLQTESVTYISQRAEALAGLFFLLTVYCSLRPGRRWTVLAIVCCALGMMTKEVVALAPVVVLLVDRVFVVGSFREAWAVRRRLYAGLAATWIVLAVVFLSAPASGRGVATTGSFVSLHNLAAQVGVVAHYVRLIVWPDPLVFDYGPTAPPGTMPFVVAIGIVVVVCGALVWLWVHALRGGKQGLLLVALAGSVFLLSLAPSSSLVPVTFQPAAENRVYFALAAVVGLLCAGAWRISGHRAALLLAVVAVVLGIATERRNRDYRDEFTLWTDTLEKRPQNWRAHYSVALALSEKEGSAEDAIARYREALRLNPDLPQAYNNIGTLLSLKPERTAEAIGNFESALRLKPDFAQAHFNLAEMLAGIPGRRGEAIAHYESALRLAPGFPNALLGLGNALLAIPRRAPEAIPYYEDYLAARPESTEARVNLAAALFQAGRVGDSIKALEEVVRRDPGYEPARQNLERLRAMPR